MTNTGRPDDGSFDVAWITNLKNAWRLAEGELIPFTRAIEKGKYDRSIAVLLRRLEPGTLPVEGQYPVADLHSWLLRVHKAFEEAGAPREPRNVTVESFIHCVFSYAIPSIEALQKAASFSGGKLLEIGAGRGYWAALLGNLGVDVQAFDVTPDPATNPWTAATEKLDFLLSSEKVEPIANRIWCRVHEGSPNSLRRRNRDSSMLLIWPPKEGLARECLEKFEGSRLIYVGEPKGLGCAENEFFDTLWAGWDLVDVIDIPRFPWLCDSVFLYKRKARA